MTPKLDLAAGSTLPRRHRTSPADLPHALEHARILRGAGDDAGAARVLDDAFAAEGVRVPGASEQARFRALVLRAELAIRLHDDAWAERVLFGEESLLRQVGDALTSLDESGQRMV